ncbi:hypothetical protein [Aminobacter sp. LjRoot7]|uniref:hypothetical protein n=1 Tax=Aminobacter sp. LjRoot7 TaxID=3342335 RepID=UPI003ECDE240
MPRNGSGVMSWPPNTNGVPNTTVSSTRYNAFLADLLADLNAARPITAGGTGGNTAVSGNDNLNTTGADMASAATLNLANATGVVVNVTGTTPITALGTVNSGAIRTLIFAGALTLTHNATSLILPGGANITTAAGDTATFRSKGAGNWVCVGYQRSTGGLTVNTLVQPTLTLKQGATATPTAEGGVEWDTDDNVLAIGDGAATQLFVPIPASTAAGDIEYFTAAKVKARLAKGTAAQVLQMNSGATAPEWAAPIASHQGVAKAWVSFNGTGTVAINDSFNVSSITDNGVGNYTVNFASALANANYAAVGMASGNLRDVNYSGGTKTTSAIAIVVGESNVGGVDTAYVGIIVMGD